MATDTGNRILDRLKLEALERLDGYLEEVTIKSGQIIHMPGEEIVYLHFPIDCLISITTTLSDGKVVETGAVGNREVAGINAFMGGMETTQTEYVGQIPGRAYKIAAAPLKIEFDRNNSLRHLLLKYTQAFIAQLSQNTACNRVHQVDERCARWLLESRDRISSNDVGLTQEFISHMLGSNRVSASLAMGKLKEEGVLDYSRGKIVILNGDALKKHSCECYFVLRNEYDRLLGPQASH